MLACLFKIHRLLAKKDAWESDESARKRALACANKVDNGDAAEDGGRWSDKAHLQGGLNRLRVPVISSIR